MDHPFVEVAKRLALRADRKEHAKVDFGFVLDDDWMKCPPVFYFGIAHVLRHRARALAIKVKEACGRNRGQMQQDLARVFECADEFYWLSNVNHHGLLKGKPDFSSCGMSCHELLFQARIVVEWGDLIQEAWLARELGLATPVLPNSSAGSRTLGIWSMLAEACGAHSAASRASARYSVALEALQVAGSRRTSIGKGEFAAARCDIEWALCMGEAGVALMSSKWAECRTKLAKAKSLCGKGTDKRGMLKRINDMRKQADEQDGRDEGKLLAENASGRPRTLAKVHILGGWIQDLLLRKGEEALHLRVFLEETEFRRTSIREFPDVSTMRRLTELLKSHRPWLRFVAKDAADYLHKIGEIEANDSKLREGVSREPTKHPDQNQGNLDRWELFVLRDWGSYTPVLPAALCPQVRHAGTGGGGYFLRWGPLGIVIDPGFDYLAHFFEAKLSLEEITHVIVTHDHYDHVASFGPLLNLLFEHRRASQAANKNIDFLLSRGVLDQYARLIVDFSYFEKVEPLTDQDQARSRVHVLWEEEEKSVTLRTTHTEHGNRDGFGKGVGLLVQFSPNLPVLGLTSDTGWYDKDELGDDPISEGLASQFSQAHVMVLHIGSLKREELRDSGFYRTHLGARGAFRLINALPSCRLVILTEFGEECWGHRLWFANLIDQWFRKRPRFRCFPSDRKTSIVAEAGLQFSLRMPQTSAASAGAEYAEVAYEQAEVVEGKGGLRLRNRRKPDGG